MDGGGTDGGDDSNSAGHAFKFKLLPTVTTVLNDSETDHNECFFPFTSSKAAKRILHKVCNTISEVDDA